MFLFDLIGGYILDVVYIDRLEIQKSLELGTILASTSGRQAILRVSAFFCWTFESWHTVRCHFWGNVSWFPEMSKEHRVAADAEFGYRFFVDAKHERYREVDGQQDPRKFSGNKLKQATFVWHLGWYGQFLSLNTGRPQISKGVNILDRPVRILPTFSDAKSILRSSLKWYWMG